MINLDNVLRKETNNQNSIYLYQEDEIWCAYEHSAYHFLHLFEQANIRQIEPYVCVSIDKHLSFLNHRAMKNAPITSMDNHQIEIACETVFIGFEQWKQDLMGKKGF